ncbi:hypothetical protein SpCBS45565_g06929 [Spizellomyces sp. 'palustris']|nr:hypothetical protein SpCBS45565_g06929 [Spizellomyces sp. 'palustris']
MIGRVYDVLGSLWGTVSTLVQPKDVPNVDGKSEFTFTFTKQCFEQVMTNPVLFSEFKKFSLTLHCHENLVFYESVQELESLLTLKVPSYVSPSALSRFVHAGTDSHPASASPSPVPIPSSLLGHFLYFHACYLTLNAPTEINLPSITCQAIALRMMNSTQGLYSDVFDRAVDEVLSMIYFDSFGKFVESKSGCIGQLEGLPDVRPESKRTLPPRLVPIVQNQSHSPTTVRTPMTSASFDLDFLRSNRSSDGASDSGVSLMSTRSTRTVASIKIKLAGAKKKMGRVGRAVVVGMSPRSAR